MEDLFVSQGLAVLLCVLACLGPPYAGHPTYFLPGLRERRRRRVVGLKLTGSWGVVFRRSYAWRVLVWSKVRVLFGLCSSNSPCGHIWYWVGPRLVVQVSSFRAARSLAQSLALPRYIGQHNTSSIFRMPAGSAKTCGVRMYEACTIAGFHCSPDPKLEGPASAQTAVRPGAVLMFVIFFGAFFTSELIPHATWSFGIGEISTRSSR